ncbi:hypothetical protein AVEN_9578-1 [Araneus ventricosus]|uniref:Uncharacterized protein n=1 Tax=Araneus ventricosus TaxID=182803 RepID=A0A4Y2H8K2_ARAVE|nr:hypothetical protein AVEN_9578-1 [Araneus ventricosus]
MRSCCRSVCFLLLMDSKVPPCVGHAWRPIRRVVHCWSPVYQFGWYTNHLVRLLGIKRKGHSLGLRVKGGQRSWSNPIKLRGYNSVRKDAATRSNLSGGVCIVASNLYAKIPLTLHTSLKAVAVQVHARTFVTVCSVYLPPHDVISQYDIDTLVNQLSTPFILQAISTDIVLCGVRMLQILVGRKIERIISNNCLCLLNNNEKMYFHEPATNLSQSRSGHLFSYTSTVAAFTVGSDLSNADITEVVQNVIDCSINAANNIIPKCSPRLRKFRRPWWNDACRQSPREERKLWNIFRRYLTTENHVTFKRDKAFARRIRNTIFLSCFKYRKCDPFHSIRHSQYSRARICTSFRN